MSVVKRRRYPGGGRKHLQLYTNVKRSAAYYSLSDYARCALIELIDRFNVWASESWLTNSSALTGLRSTPSESWMTRGLLIPLRSAGILEREPPSGA